MGGRGPVCPLVLEMGSETVRAGLGGKDTPSLTMPCVVGRPRSAQEPAGPAKQEVFFGEEAMLLRGSGLRIKYPVEWGVITNWDDLQSLWEHVVKEKLGTDMENTPLVFVEGEVMNPKSCREKVTQIAFETFQAPAFYLAPSPAMVLKATGRSTGLVVDIASDLVRAVPVYETYCLKHYVMKYDFGSRSLTDYLTKLLAEREGVENTSREFRQEARAMKEQHAYVAQDYKQEMETFSLSQERQHRMPNDGELITLGRERFQCVEPLFQPQLIGMERWGLPQHVVNTVRKCDPEIRQELLGNVILAGGASALPGLASRLQHEIDKETSQEFKVLGNVHAQVLAPPGGDLLAWKGASMLTDSPVFLDMCISSEEYDEYGPTLVHRKCF